uniref:Putative ovule protein n=1 Tax=Solanum chacoense TaxID=4108 RepID=A0A0V0HA65_SOLCH
MLDFLTTPSSGSVSFGTFSLLIFSASCLLCHLSLILFVGWMTVKRIRFGQFQRLIPSAHSCALPFQCWHCNLNIIRQDRGVSQS